MEQGKDPITDESIWKEALEKRFLPPPSQWIFLDNAISFHNNLYKVNKATIYELALLDIHAQYWEVTTLGHLRRYHRSLQYKVEVHFQSNKAMEVHKSPEFLRSWLIRIILKKPHDLEGRKMTLKILEDVSAEQRSKLEMGTLQSEGIISTFMPIKDISFKVPRLEGSDFSQVPPGRISALDQAHMH
jgi:hypothetical protein